MGIHIVELLVKTKTNIIILDNLVTGHKKRLNKKALFIKEDIKNKIKYNNLKYILKSTYK
jgi:UDP-glucose 4-epimerase